MEKVVQFEIYSTNYHKNCSRVYHLRWLNSSAGRIVE